MQSPQEPTPPGEGAQPTPGPHTERQCGGNPHDSHYAHAAQMASQAIDQPLAAETAGAGRCDVFPEPRIMHVKQTQGCTHNSKHDQTAPRYL
jgi:hypothetical protein